MRWTSIPGRGNSSTAAPAGPSAHAVAAAAMQRRHDLAGMERSVSGELILRSVYPQGHRAPERQTVISRTYRPPAKRSTVKTRRLSSTYTSFSWIEPAFESLGAGGT